MILALWVLIALAGALICAYAALEAWRDLQAYQRASINGALQLIARQRLAAQVVRAAVLTTLALIGFEAAGTYDLLDMVIITLAVAHTLLAIADLRVGTATRRELTP